MSKVTELHAKAIEVREKEQDLEKALKILDEALLLSPTAEEISGISGTRQNIYQHLSDKSGDETYLILAKHSAMAAVEIAEKNNLDEKSLPYRDLGNIQAKLSEYDESVSSYKKSINHTESPSLKRPGVHAEIMSQFGFSLYMSGSKEAGINNLNNAIEELVTEKEANKFEHDVWLSGAYMRKAKAVYKDDHQAGQEALQKAKEIIESNSDLVLRKQQLEKLSAELVS